MKKILSKEELADKLIQRAIRDAGHPIAIETSANKLSEEARKYYRISMEKAIELCGNEANEVYGIDGMQKLYLCYTHSIQSFHDRCELGFTPVDPVTALQYLKERGAQRSGSGYSYYSTGTVWEGKDGITRSLAAGDRGFAIKTGLSIPEYTIMKIQTLQ